jgi:regulatory protein
MLEFDKALDKLQAQCVKREYCRADIFRKALDAFDGDRETAEKLVDSLVADKFVDDSRYAAAFAREKARLSGWGPVKISCALVMKGIPKAVVADALKEVNQEEADRRMVSVLETKYRALKGDPQEKFKLIRFGLTRGYEYEKIAPVVDEILRKNR